MYITLTLKTDILYFFGHIDNKNTPIEQTN